MSSNREDEEEIPFEKGLPKPLPPKKLAPGEKVEWICAADIESKPVHWFWNPYVPMGMLTLISGDPGLGKSWITMDIAARASTGRDMPGVKRKSKMPPRKVILMNYEDSPEHTIIPRLEVLGADRSNIIMPARGFTLDADGVRLMENRINEASVGLVFIDPIVAAIGAGVDMNKANEVRAVMGALGQVAHRTGTAIIAVRHLRKAGRGDGGKDIYAGLGSIDFTASVRSELMVEKTKTGEKIVKHIKCNVGPLGPAMHYHYDTQTTIDKFGEPEHTTRFEWLGEYAGTDIYDIGKGHAAPKRDEARDWLKDYLREGPKVVGDVYKAAKLKGISEKTLKRAKEGMVESKQSGMNLWEWQLIDGENTLHPDILKEAQRRLAETA